MALTTSEVEALTRAIERWEWAEYIFTALVAVACFGEYIADFTEWWKRGGFWKCFGEVSHRKERVAKVSTLVLVGALSAELLCLVVTNQKSGRLVGVLGDRAEEAATKSTKALDNATAANASAENATRGSAVARDLAKSAVADIASIKPIISLAQKEAQRLSELAIQQQKVNGSFLNRLLDRHIDARFKEAFRSLPVGKLDIQVVPNDEETITFALEIRNALAELGWTVSIAPIVAPPPPTVPVAATFPSYQGVHIVNSTASGLLLFGPPNDPRVVAGLLGAGGQKVDDRVTLLVILLKAREVEKDESLRDGSFRIIVGKNTLITGAPLPPR